MTDGWKAADPFCKLLSQVMGLHKGRIKGLGTGKMNFQASTTTLVFVSLIKDRI